MLVRFCFIFKLQTRIEELNIVPPFAYYDLRIYQVKVKMFYDFNFAENLIKFMADKKYEYLVYIKKLTFNIIYYHMLQI